MKTLLSFSIIIILSVAFFSGCKQNPNSSLMSMKAPPPPPPPPPDAHPEWTFSSTATTTAKVNGIIGRTTAPAFASSVGSAIKIYSKPWSNGGDSTTTFLNSLSWSNDGTKIAFVELTGFSPSYYALKVIDVSTYVVQTLIPASHNGIWRAVWSHTG